MKTILLPVDFSDNSVENYKYAITLAGSEKETLLHFHHSYNDQIAAPDPGINSGLDNDSFLNMQLVEEFRKQSLQNMKSLTENVRTYLSEKKLNNFTIDYSVEGGDPDWEILSVSKEINPEIIIMGTQGEGRKDIFEGSVAKKIMNKAGVPVIALPIGSHYLHKDVNIMYPCNNREKDFMKINLLFTLFKNLKVNIHVVHFHIDGIKDKNVNIISELSQAFEEKAKNNKISFTLVNASKKEKALGDFTLEKNINAIAFIAHKTSFFRSLFTDNLTKDDFFKLGLPMIALHE